MGPSWYRPANISATLGITWVSIGAYSVTAPLTALLRQLVPSSTFTTTAFAVPPGAPAAAYMGTYAPIVVVCSRAQFQLNYCASPSHATSGSRQDRLRIDGGPYAGVHATSWRVPQSDGPVNGIPSPVSSIRAPGS